MKVSSEDTMEMDAAKLLEYLKIVKFKPEMDRLQHSHTRMSGET